VLIRVASNRCVHHIIYIIVVYIPETYGLLLSRNWLQKLQGYLATNWSHLWLLWNGRPNQIRIDRERHMKYAVTKLEGTNEPIMFWETGLGNDFLASPTLSDKQSYVLSLLFHDANSRWALQSLRIHF
jgi:hypothetical protein